MAEGLLTGVGLGPEAMASERTVSVAEEVPASLEKGERRHAGWTASVLHL
jgi:hypothetical protein